MTISFLAEGTRQLPNIESEFAIRIEGIMDVFQCTICATKLCTGERSSEFAGLQISGGRPSGGIDRKLAPWDTNSRHGLEVRLGDKLVYPRPCPQKSPSHVCKGCCNPHILLCNEVKRSGVRRRKHKSDPLPTSNTAPRNTNRLLVQSQRRRRPSLFPSTHPQLFWYTTSTN